MIVCHCHRVSDRDVLDAIRGGARTATEVAEVSMAGSGCGGCVGAIDDLLEAEGVGIIPLPTVSSFPPEIHAAT